ncbi:MAG: phage holin family protein [Oscillatoriaceae cyanobacterium Prado104]|jgi:putative membrane protein|nr:phage holin family protein [Oscillatoriaceae cyanobacterium Prado104]
MEPIDILIAWLVTGSSLLLISQFPIGVEIDSTPKAVISAAVLGILNVLILPILKTFFFLPNLLTLGLLSGLFAFVMNVIIFAVAAKVVEGFRLRMGIWSAILGAIALAAASSLIDGVLL